MPARERGPTFPAFAYGASPSASVGAGRPFLWCVSDVSDVCLCAQANLRKSMHEAFRVLKPGGVCVISTRSKQPKYEDLYWYAVLAPKAVAQMSERVPSVDDLKTTFEEAGFEVTQCVCPKFKSIMHPTHYHNAKGVFEVRVL